MTTAPGGVPMTNAQVVRKCSCGFVPMTDPAERFTPGDAVHVISIAWAGRCGVVLGYVWRGPGGDLDREYVEVALDVQASDGEVRRTCIVAGAAHRVAA